METKKVRKIAIIGYGWVGKAMKQLFSDAIIYSHGLDEGGMEINMWDHHIPELRKMVNKCDIAFICVPTPFTIDSNGLEGKLDTSAVEESVAWCQCPLQVIRSTVNPGTSWMLYQKYGKHIVMQPEYLGETPAHPMLDPKTRPFLILGGEKEDTRKLINLYTTVYNANMTIRQVTAEEAEIIKLTENRAIGCKVAECQELYDVCELAGVDYYTIRDAVYGDDPRMNLWWTFIFPDKRGFNSKCMPKDVYAWCAWAESLGYKPEITRGILERNKKWIQQSV